jgi:hypothetical protein
MTFDGTQKLTYDGWNRLARGVAICESTWFYL